MDVEKIGALLRALQLGSLSAAAEELGYTPSGMSRMMASLEAELGFPLLIRARDGLRATRECERLLPHLQTLAGDAELTQRVADALRGVESGSVYVGTPYPAYFQELSRLMAAFSEKHPGIHLGLLEGMSSELAQKVERREADFCIISERDGDFDFLPLIDDPLVALVSPEHPLSKAARVTPEDLSREPFILLHPEVDTDCSRYLQAHGVEPDVCFSCRDTYAVYHMVEAGLGITVDNALFAASVQSGVRAVPLDPPQIVPIGIATPRGELLSPAAAAFLAMAEEIFLV